MTVLPSKDQQHGDPATPNAITLPARSFYWAMLDAVPISGILNNSRKTHRQLGYLFENVLPVPIEDVHATYVRLGDDRCLACGMDKQLLSAHANGLIYLGPSHLPPHITESVEPRQINLLIGEFESARLRRLKAKWFMQLSTIILLATTLIAVGIQRRVIECRSLMDQLQETRQRILQLAGIDLSPLGQPPELRLTAELRRLRQTRQGSVTDSQLTDVVPTLASLLSNWPEQAQFQTETIVITPTAITVRGVVPTSSSAQVMASAINIDRQDALRGQGWAMAQPHVTNTRNEVQVVLQMNKTQQEAHQ